MRFFIITLALIGLACAQRAGRQQEAANNYGAPIPSESQSAPTFYGGPEVAESRSSASSYQGPDGRSGLQQYESSLDAQASEVDQRTIGSGDPLDLLKNTIPGNPGEDYPVLAEAPETSFKCEGKFNGGYYADPEAQCQAFHICFADAEGSLAKYSFLCPNGTIFNQDYFICDWWFNVDCSKAESLAEARNAELDNARKEADAKLASSQGLEAAASVNRQVVAVQPNYGSPINNQQAEYGGRY